MKKKQYIVVTVINDINHLQLLTKTYEEALNYVKNIIDKSVFRYEEITKDVWYNEEIDGYYKIIDKDKYYSWD